MPELVGSGSADPSRAVWLLPTQEWQRARLEERRTPDRGRENVIEYQLLVAGEIERQARTHGVTVHVVEGKLGIDEMVAVIEELFGSALAAGPRAETIVERRALLRYANAAVVEQALAYLARPWSLGDPEKFVRTFVCECDDPKCDETVELAVAGFQRAAACGPVLADSDVR